MGDSFPSLGGSRQIEFANRGIDPPTDLYITSDDQLLVDVWNSAASNIVVVGARTLLPEGIVVPNTWAVTPSTDRAQNRRVFALPEGFFIGFGVFATGALPRRGQTYCRVGLVRMSAPGNVPAQVLFSGYLTGLSLSGGPPGANEAAQSGIGFARSIVGAVPAAGAEISESVPSNAMWRPISFSYRLTSSAAVATRVSHLVIDDGANVFTNIVPPSSQAAGVVQNYQFGDSLVPQVVTDGWVTVPFPNNIFLQSGFRIGTLTTNIQAGDQYTAPVYLVEEWISP